MCKGSSWKRKSIWYCADGETEGAVIEGTKTGGKKETK